METQAAGRRSPGRLLYAAPWSTVRTYRGQAAPSSSGHTISPHAGHRPLSLCVSAVLPLAHHQGSCQAPSLLLHSYHSGSSRVCIHLHDGRFANDGSPTRRLHARAAHRVPTARADRPPCRPHTGMRPSCIHSCAFSFAYAHSRPGGIAISTSGSPSPLEVH
jgi:hypothetical protein